MFLLSGYLILCCLTLSCDCYQLKNKLCEMSPCLYLYETPNSYFTWYQNYETCSNEGLNMTRIESNQTQTAVERLLQHIPQDAEQKVWIGGQRSNDSTWKFMNGTVFNKTVNEQTSNLHCIYARLCKVGDTEYHAENCDEKTSPSRLLCQYEPIETGRCNSPDDFYGNKCYMKTSFGGNGTRIDWYKGQTYCSQSDIHGDIAYSYLDNDTLINNIIDLVHPNADCAQLWLGVRRRIWLWKTYSKSNEDIKAINYYNWQEKTKVDSSDDNCIYLDVAKDNKWLAASCNNAPLKYFMCMKNKDNSQTPSPTTTTTKTKGNTSRATSEITSTIGAHRSTATISATITSEKTSTANISPSINDNVGSLSNTNKSSFKPGFIIGAVVGLVVLAVVVGLAVFFVLRKRRKQTSAKQSKAEELQYDDVELDGDNDDVIDPYGVVGAENAEKVEVRHKQAPSGDLYAVSSKQVNKIDVSKNEEDKNPDVVYAQPKKKKNQKTKNREENGTAKSGNDVDSEKPSGGETGAGSKHTEHFEAPSGEVYARIIKDGKDTDE